MQALAKSIRLCERDPSLTLLDLGAHSQTGRIGGVIAARARTPSVGLLEFHQIDEARAAGRRAAEAALQDAPAWLLDGAGTCSDLSGRRTVLRV
jgi:predicted acylesterase/phospholipase RssA